MMSANDAWIYSIGGRFGWAELYGFHSLNLNYVCTKASLRRLIMNRQIQ